MLCKSPARHLFISTSLNSTGYCLKKTAFVNCSVNFERFSPFKDRACTAGKILLVVVSLFLQTEDRTLNSKRWSSLNKDELTLTKVSSRIQFSEAVAMHSCQCTQFIRGQVIFIHHWKLAKICSDERQESHRLPKEKGTAFLSKTAKASHIYTSKLMPKASVVVSLIQPIRDHTWCVWFAERQTTCV